MNFRLAQPEDAPKIAKVHVDSWRAAYRGIVPDDFLQQLSYDRRERAFRGAAEEGSEETYLIEEEGQVAGILTIGACRDPDLDIKATGEIIAIYIAPGYWRRGYGRRLIQEAERLLKGRGCQHIVLWVLEDNAAARHFYEAMGYQPDGASKTLVLGKSLNVVRYTLS